MTLLLGTVAVAALVSSGLLWQKLSAIQEQLARQSADSGALAIEARTMARQAEELVRDTVAQQADKYIGVDRKVVLAALDARVEQLFQADFLLDLLKRQIGQVFKPLYLSLLLFAALLLAMIATEILLSRRLRQWHSALQPTLAQPQMQQGEGPVGTIQR